MTVQIIRGNALDLPLADDSVDLVVTSPPYFGLRSYQDGGTHYDGQIGDEATPAEFVDALVAATREMVRVVKPSGSIWVNLGDKYGGFKANPGTKTGLAGVGKAYKTQDRGAHGTIPGTTPKSLIGIPWRYALRCIDDLGLILRAEVIWSKPNGLPESVTDRVRRSHEQWFHFTLSPRYYSAVDEIREEQGKHSWNGERQQLRRDPKIDEHSTKNNDGRNHTYLGQNPLGKLPGSVWTIPTEPLHVPEHLGVDHFAAFPTEWPRRIITGWSPRGLCVECGEGRRPVSVAGDKVPSRQGSALNGVNAARYLSASGRGDGNADAKMRTSSGDALPRIERIITGEACACPEPTAPTRPGVVLDSFGGTGTTALVADALGRHAVHVDMSRDYCRLATWRTSDPKQRAKAARRQFVPPREQLDGQLDLLEGLGA